KMHAVRDAGSAKVDALRSARCSSFDSAKHIGAKGIDGIRNATAASSAVCSSGVDKVRFVKAAAKERGAEALNAAAAVGGVSLSRQKPPEMCRCCPALPI
ncbi:MAG: hypothetical protein QF516_08420, partial [Pirellulaceae bacterium]|nr:hypothetical protein [Pirellulaceae bacterium]